MVARGARSPSQAARIWAFYQTVNVPATPIPLTSLIRRRDLSRCPSGDHLIVQPSPEDDPAPGPDFETGGRLQPQSSMFGPPLPLALVPVSWPPES